MKDLSKHLYIIAGANGSGKSTFCSEFLQEEPLTFLNADDIAKSLCPENMESVKISAGKELYKRLDKLLDNKSSFAIETTLSGSNYLKIIQKAKESGYEITLIYTFLDDENLCINRIKTRVLKGGHDIPDEDVKRRYYRSKNNFWHLYKDLIDDWVIYYNGETGFIKVVEASGNTLEVVDEALYNDFKKDLK
jgi:predicted ABC-type ATPase